MNLHQHPDLADLNTHQTPELGETTRDLVFRDTGLETCSEKKKYEYWDQVISFTCHKTCRKHMLVIS